MTSCELTCSECGEKYWALIADFGFDDPQPPNVCKPCRCKNCSLSFEYANGHYVGCLLRNDMQKTFCKDNVPMVKMEST